MYALVKSHRLLIELSLKGACGACHVFNEHAKDCKLMAQIKLNNETLSALDE